MPLSPALKILLDIGIKKHNNETGIDEVTNEVLNSKTVFLKILEA